MRINLDTGDVESFVAVASMLSFSAAAEMLGMSPSAISRRILKLETQLQIRLLDRTTREVRLTLPGKQFLDRSRELLQSVDEMVTAIHGEAMARASSITVACVPSVSGSILPNAVRAFSERYPQTHIRIQDATTNVVLDAVQKGDADFGVTTSFGVVDISLEFCPMVRASYVLAVPNDHPLADRKSVTWEDLSGLRVVSTWKGSGVRMVRDLNLAKVGLRIPWFCEVKQIYTALSFVEMGLGVTPVPGFFLKRGSYDVTAIPISDPAIAVDLGLVRSRERRMRKLAIDFWDMLVADVDQMRLSGQLPTAEAPSETLAFVGHAMDLHAD